MAEIAFLDESTINQIAAGEVIENPASVVKELVENALDSGASEISIETKAGGRSLIKVIDNGRGMSEEDLLLSIERHATSKLKRVQDLNSLITLGFRGEALPSIASISKLSIHTSPDSGKGSLLRLEGGKIENMIPSPRKKGCSVEVKSLFYNVPVRRKFQKSVAWDTAEIHKVLTKFTLSYPACGFSWKHDEKLQFSFTEDEGLEERVKLLLGEEFFSKMVHVEQNQGELCLNGYISHPSLHRPHRSGQYLFINQRAVVSPLISKRVLEGYGTRLPTHRFPLFVLFLTLPSSWVDVNVHPQKREVRLTEESTLAHISTMIEQALETLSRPTNVILPAMVAEEPLVEYSAPSIPKFEEPFVIEPCVRVIGKIKNYLFVEEEDGIRVIDGKRALERIVYEQLHLSHAKQEVQSLLLPLHLEFTGKEKAHLLERMDELIDFGVSIRHFGGDTFVVDAIPAVMEGDEIADLISLFLEEGALKNKMGRCLKRRAIHTLEQGIAVVEKLMRCHHFEETPDGKPIYYLLNEKELEKKFS